MQWKHAKCCVADSGCHGNEIWARRADPVAYGLRLMFTYLLLLYHRRGTRYSDTRLSTVRVSTGGPPRVVIWRCL